MNKEEPKSLKKEFTQGTAYMAIAKYAGIVVSLVITSILARLISPDDFGVIAIATVIIVFLSMFTELGISPAIVQKQNLTEKDLSSIFSFTIWGGVIIAVLFFLLSWIIAGFYNDPTLVNICQILTINVLFSAWNIVPNGLLMKAKAFKFMAYRTLIFQIIGGGLSILAAFKGAGVYALVINPIFTSIGLFIVTYYKYPIKFICKIQKESLSKIASFSTYQFLFNFLNYFSRNLDKLIIGKYIGMTPLGYYEKSYRLMLLPLQNITNVITPVMHPIFASYQDDKKRLVQNYLKIVKFLGLIGFPLSIFLFLSSKDLILIFFGNQWLLAVPIFSILSLSVGVQMITSSAGSIFQALNATKYMFWCGVTSSVINIIGLFSAILLFGSLESIAWALVITFIINFFIGYYIMFVLAIKNKMTVFLKQLISPIILSFLMLIFLFPTYLFIEKVQIHFPEIIKHGIFADILPPIISLAVKFIIFAFVWIIYVQLRSEYDLLGVFKRKILKKR